MLDSILFHPVQCLDACTNDQESMLLGIAQVSPYTARTIIEEAIYYHISTTQDDGTKLLDGTPAVFRNRWRFQQWITNQSKNAKAALSLATRLARQPHAPDRQAHVIQSLVTQLRGEAPSPPLSAPPMKRQATADPALPLRTMDHLTGTHFDAAFWQIPPHLLSLANASQDQDDPNSVDRKHKAPVPTTEAPIPKTEETGWFSEYHGAVVRAKDSSQPQELEVAAMHKTISGFLVGIFEDGTTVQTERANMEDFAPATAAPLEALTPSPAKQPIKDDTPSAKKTKHQKKPKQDKASSKVIKAKPTKAKDTAESTNETKAKATKIKAKPTKAKKPKAKAKAKPTKAQENRPPAADDAQAWLAFRPQGCARCREVAGCTRSCRNTELQKRKWQ
jgi:hypothetical protein